MSVPGTYPHRVAILRPPMSSAPSVHSVPTTSSIVPTPTPTSTPPILRLLEPNGCLEIKDTAPRYLIKATDVGNSTIKLWANSMAQFPRDIRIITQTHPTHSSIINLEVYEDKELTIPASTIYMSKFSRPPYGVCGSIRETILSRVNPSQKIVDIHHISYDGDVIVSTIY